MVVFCPDNVFFEYCPFIKIVRSSLSGFTLKTDMAGTCSRGFILKASVAETFGLPVVRFVFRKTSNKVLMS
ncbi:hypothetical protein [uncultured Desulfobacter sp.]|uniref:hypothetical protein n=1 Tax=uncultured Desulfobacter sp. TaxID=240139 RepID=UPI002AA8787A|nr:hypothetical protein [uncultured Desulfobacter sp.]